MPHNAFTQYFTDLYRGVVTTYKGLRLTIGYFCKPKVTMRYPEQRPDIMPGHRGKHIYLEEKCSLCKACVTACPVDCIKIESVGRGRQGMPTVYDIDYGKCLFCNLCCEACNTDCLFLGEQYDMAAAEHAGCVIHFARTKSPEEIAAFQAKLAQKEAEKKAAAEAAQPKPEEPQL